MSLHFRLQILQSRLDLAQGVERGAHHRVENRVDEVLLAASPRRVDLERARQRNRLDVQGQHVLAADQDMYFNRLERF